MTEVVTETRSELEKRKCKGAFVKLIVAALFSLLAVAGMTGATPDHTPAAEGDTTCITCWPVT